MGRNSDLRSRGVRAEIDMSSEGIQQPGKVSKTKLIVVDDQKVVIEGVKRILEPWKEFDVVGEALNGARAVKLVESLKPDVVIMDISMPIMNGIEATARIKRQFPETKVLIFSMYSDKEYITRLLRIGISGYILKDDPHSDLVQAIKVIVSGATYFSKIFVDIVGEHLREIEEKIGCQDPFEHLSMREQEVFRHLAEGKSTKEIASLLFISPKTVESHKYNIMQKMGLNSVGELIRFAIRQKILTP